MILPIVDWLSIDCISRVDDMGIPLLQYITLNEHSIGFHFVVGDSVTVGIIEIDTNIVVKRCVVVDDGIVAGGGEEVDAIIIVVRCSIISNGIPIRGFEVDTQVVV
jgi:hypothetical protein